MKIENEITVGEGKYRFIQYFDDYRIHCLRYEEPWMIFTKGHKALGALMFDYQAILKISSKAITGK